ncbi:CwfJ C-terminus 2-domain-containing protein-like protein [Podospora appendiculata]|uniref:CwfJ C-terminus 2-domain-containing protein-like protein n=1 Tax=Podospora appendiculata TaxID=314037 RepID=A0AAE1CHJ6_9PEZI|nr:CwfJ C-terminus 2-domain-containing protein-like protein [Podospora appendiculata]
MAAKIFVFGSVNGQLQAAFNKLATLHSKTVFSFAIVTGNLFSDAQDDDQLTALLSGQLNIACPTYFTVGTLPLPPRIVEKIESDEEIAPNLHYLGKRSVTKTSEGVRIVALGGMLDTTIVGGQSKEQHLPFHTEDDAKALRGANNADILLTTAWPAEVWKNSARAKELKIDAAAAPSSQTIADLCAALKPRYHFAMSQGDFFFEREPFFPEAAEEATGGDKGVAITRFISMAPWANAAKAKSMYAFTINRETIITPPLGSTLTPFYKSAPKKRNADQAEFSRFSNANGHTHDNDSRRRKHRRDRSPPPGPERCFFCLSNPNLPTYMVCNVGDDAYLATAKGPLPSADTFKRFGLDFPGHIIITPLTHAPSLSIAAMGESESKKTYAEMKRFRESLQGMVSSKSKGKLGAVTWEINRARNIHVHWQFLPVPAEMIQRGLVEAGFRVLAEDLDYGKFAVKEFDTADEVEGDYLRVWFWAENDDVDGGSVTGKSLLLRFDETIRFDLQFPRKVMAKLLELEKRVTWQEVAQSESEEMADVDAFRAAFKEWDFTLQI